VTQPIAINQARIAALTRAAIQSLTVLLQEIEQPAWAAHPTPTSPRSQSRESYDPITTPRCPDCEGPMKQRTSARGPFWGCIRYPHCQGTRPGGSEKRHVNSEHAPGRSESESWQGGVR